MYSSLEYYAITPRGVNFMAVVGNESHGDENGVQAYNGAWGFVPSGVHGHSP